MSVCVCVCVRGRDRLCKFMEMTFMLHQNKIAEKENTYNMTERQKEKLYLCIRRLTLEYVKKKERKKKNCILLDSLIISIKLSKQKLINF